MKQKEHKKDLKQLEGVKYTRTRRQGSLTESHWSALMDHVASKNHTINCDGMRLTAKEPDGSKRGVKEASVIRKLGMHTVNWGHHLLPEVFSKLLCHET